MSFSHFQSKLKRIWDLNQHQETGLQNPWYLLNGTQNWTEQLIPSMAWCIILKKWPLPPIQSEYKVLFFHCHKFAKVVCYTQSFLQWCLLNGLQQMFWTIPHLYLWIIGLVNTVIKVYGRYKLYILKYKTWNFQKNFQVIKFIESLHSKRSKTSKDTQRHPKISKISKDIQGHTKQPQSNLRYQRYFVKFTIT